MDRARCAVHEDGRLVVLFSGGGTGGHLYPALALAEALVELRPDVRPFFVGAERGIEARVLPEQQVEHALLPVRGFARGQLLSNWRIVPTLFRSLTRVFGLFRSLRPALVVVTGGYASGPSGIVAALRRVPLVIQEQNSVPGFTTRLLSRWAREVHVAFPEAALGLPVLARDKVVESGNPIRPPHDMDPELARSAFELAPGGTVVLVAGGSQGSAALNAAVLEAVRLVESGERARPEGIQLLWSTGPAHAQAIRVALADLQAPSWVRAVGYIHDMPTALAAADLAVSRAGAIATSEFLAWGLPAVLVPLPTAAANHQEHNAVALAQAGAAVHLPQSQLSGARLLSAIEELAADPVRLEARRSAARQRGRPESARRIAASLAALLPAPMADPT
jgi:UDP-N-acetylglucosamine--N-acetylmuramyl-(pentapeptide) pyrophosphoryl-undecaprenol N-acetylglucosamine transferase